MVPSGRSFFVRYPTHCGGESRKRSTDIVGEARVEPSLSTHEMLDFLGEPLASHVQATFDGADRSIEMITHLQQ